MISYGGGLVSGNSDESDSVDRPETGQKLDQSTTKLTMTLGRCLAILVVVQLVLGVVVLLLATAFQVGLLMAMVAWLVCAVGSMVAHLFSWYPQGNEFLMARLAGAMVSRTAPALGFAVWGSRFCEPRIEKSTVLILVLVYMAGLVADSYLNLRRSRAGVEL